MYEKFFGFSERPFELTPNTRFMYRSEQHDGAIKTLKFGIDRRVGFMMMCGEPGSGKTTIIRTLVNELSGVETSVILNPLISNCELIHSINCDFGINCRSDSPLKQLEALNEYLLNLNSQGKTALVIIDEAQNLSFEALEMTRMLSNLETESQKLINILLVGQPELNNLLKDERLRQLMQRMKICINLKPLTLSDTAAYIQHRIMNAGQNSSVSFDEKAIKKVFKSSGGIPRLINNICDLGLLAAFSRSVHVVDKKIITEALREVPTYVYHS